MLLSVQSDAVPSAESAQNQLKIIITVRLALPARLESGLDVAL